MDPKFNNMMIPDKYILKHFMVPEINFDKIDKQNIIQFIRLYVDRLFFTNTTYLA